MIEVVQKSLEDLLDSLKRDLPDETEIKKKFLFISGILEEKFSKGEVSILPIHLVNEYLRQSGSKLILDERFTVVSDMTSIYLVSDVLTFNSFVQESNLGISFIKSLDSSEFVLIDLNTFDVFKRRGND